MIQEMTHIIPVYKWLGETPLACIKRIQKAYPYYKDLPLTYAGRLDPMADGLLILLVGEECKQKEQYLALSKTYIVDIAFGVGTDTYDILGVIQDHKQALEGWDLNLDSAVESFKGKQIQQYPAFSSKTVDGKPLFLYAKEGNISDITIPEHEVEVFSIDQIDEYKLSVELLKNKAIEAISQIKGDFRQDDAISSWRELKLGEIPLIRLKIRAGSGTYMRQLAYDLGKKIGIPAIAWHIFRSEVGDFKLGL